MALRTLAWQSAINPLKIEVPGQRPPPAAGAWLQGTQSISLEFLYLLLALNAHMTTSIVELPLARALGSP